MPPQGKKKRGALNVHPGFQLCTLECSNGERHTARCGIKGVLVNVNQRLLEDPSVVSDDPLGLGHIAVLQLKANGASKLVDSEEDYLAARQSGGGYGSEKITECGGGGDAAQRSKERAVEAPAPEAPAGPEGLPS